MSEPTPTTRRPAKRDRIRARLQTFNSSRGQRVLGPAEIIGLAGSLLILVLVIAGYLYFLVPPKMDKKAKIQLEYTPNRNTAVLELQ